MAKQDLVVRFVGDTDNLSKGLDNLTGRFRGITSGLAAIAGAGAAVAAVSFFKTAIDEAREAAKVTRQTENVIRSTGGAANVTAKQVSDLAERLSNLAGVDDEVIQNGANVLLTFSKVRNEMGAGNDVFDRATGLALDMSAALGTDLQGAVLQVGKALNDPVKGITALQRAGVSFTAAQKEEIKALVAKGDVLGAQKIILGELQTEFGGMAAASADAGQKASVAFANLAEKLGVAVMPAITALTEFLTNRVIPAVAGVVSWVQQNIAWLGPLAAAIGGVIVVMKAWTITQIVLNAALLANPIGIVVAALSALVGAFIYAWQNSATFRTFLVGVWQSVQNAVSVAWGVISWVFTQLGTMWVGTGTKLKWVFDSVISPVFNAMKAGVAAVGTAFQAAVGFIQQVWNGLVNVVKVPVNFVIGIYNNGIVWMWNKVAELVGLRGRLDRINYLAGGGVLGGYAPGRDTVPAMLSPGEAVLVPELVRQIGPANIMAANRAASGRPGTRVGFAGGGVVGFAGGGVIGNILDWISGVAGNVRDMVTDPIGTVKRAIGDSPWIDAAARVPAKALDVAGNFLWDKIKSLGEGVVDFFVGDIGGGVVGVLQRFAMAQRGKRYQWGATGPNTWDCSGLVGALWALAQGKPPYRRYMTTATMGVGRHGMKPGRGKFTVYLGRGHTAANVGGLHAEAYGGNGVPLAIGRVGTPLSFYHTIMHLFAGGGLVGNLAKLKTDPAKQLESFLERGWPEPPVGMKDGGWLAPGRLAYNETSKPEAVLTQRQFAGVSGPTTVVVQAGVIGSERELQNWLTRAFDKLKSQGRV